MHLHLSGPGKVKAAVSFQKRIFHGTNSVVVLVGSLRKESFTLKIANALAGWRRIR